MELDLLEAKKYLSQQGYGSGTNYTTNLVAVLLANYAQEKVKKMQQHSVMQAEGSDVSEGAAVGNSAAGKGVRVWPPDWQGKRFVIYDKFNGVYQSGWFH